MRFYHGSRKTHYSATLGTTVPSVQKEPQRPWSQQINQRSVNAAFVAQFGRRIKSYSMQDSDQERIMEPMEDTSMQVVDESPPAEPVNSPNEQEMTTEKEDENKTSGEQSGPPPIKDAAKITTESAAEPQEPEDEDAPLDLMKMREFEFSQVSNLTPAQLRRYEQYRRSDLKSSKVRKVLTALNPMMQKASEQYVIAIKGLGKLFVGDVVETALEVRKERGETGALTPRQIREAYRRLRRAGAVPTTSNWSEGSLW